LHLAHFSKLERHRSKIMRFIRDLNPETQSLLTRISCQSKSLQVRNRAKCILLSSQKFTIDQLKVIFNVDRKTIYNWLTRWEDQNLKGLYNQKGVGRKPKLSQEQKEQVKTWVKENPKSLNQVQNKIQKEWGIEISKDTIKRIIKKLNMLWKRMKRGISKSPYEWELEVKLPRLEELKKQAQKGDIAIKYLDESGFSLKPDVPYAWQEKGERITLKSCQSKRISVLGLMDCDYHLDYEIYQGTIKSDTVIKFLDKISENLTKVTVVVLDQASIHTSDEFVEKLEEWRAKKLEIFWLPPYSPKYNLIEILWRFIKYEWIEVSAYDSWKNLIKYIEKVLDNFGTEYAIHFA